jgi:hypothetical protein
VLAPLSAGQNSEEPAGSSAYDARSANNHWNGKRKTEFAGLLAPWSESRGGTQSGAALLQHLSKRCDEEDDAGRGVPTPEEATIYEFTVRTHDGAKPVTVWRRVEGTGAVNLRLAPTPGVPEARETLLHEMQKFAKASAGKRAEKPAGGIAYDAASSINSWRGKRKTEFEHLLAPWSESRGTTQSGGALLRHLSQRCDEEDDAGRGVPTPEEPTIYEFTVRTHEGANPVTVWRGLDGTGMVNLRLAPTPGVPEDREALLNEMRVSALQSTSNRAGRPAGGIAYGAASAQVQWKGKRKTEFEHLLAPWSASTGGTQSGAALLRHLSQRCDVEDVAGRGVPTPEEATIYEFTVRTHDGADPVTVWRGVDGNATGNLRLAPTPGLPEDREALLSAMRVSAKKRASYRAERPAGGIAYSALSSRGHWTGKRKTEFEHLLAPWSASRGTTQSGAAMRRGRRRRARCADARGGHDL